MKAARTLARILVPLFVACTARGEEPHPPVIVKFEAIHEVVGPAAEVWRYRSEGTYQTQVEINYSLTASGDLSGSFIRSPDYLEKIRVVAETQRFFDLPNTLSPQSIAIDGPTMRLTIEVGKRRHQVFVISPDELADDPRFQRFDAVWKAITSFLPLAPKRG
jgi:hypothetical protein